jgi:Starch-binding associating with outer membrane
MKNINYKKAPLKIAISLFVLLGLSSCEKYLDVNINPNNPTNVEAALRLAPMQNQFVLGLQFDARYIGRYIQNWHFYAAGDSWDLHGYVRNSDAGGEIWRNFYWKGGQNMVELLKEAEANQRWDYLGVGQIMNAWGWQMLTDIHGEVILKEAFIDPLKSQFNYDSQEDVYKEVDRLCLEGIKNLANTSGKASQAQLARGDILYKGDASKWIKFAYGILAMNAHRTTNKANYNPTKVIEYVDKALASNTDDALFTFNGLSTADGSFFGPLRGNMQVYGQSAFVLNLMNGTVFGETDPRMPVLLTPSADGVYRGIIVGQGSPATANLTQRILSPWGTTLNATPPAGTTGKGFFTDKGPFPLMTYAQLQFIKAEAAFIKGDKALALTAYRNGINAHLDYCKVPVADRAKYLANVKVTPKTATELTLSQIMGQKYIALWGWGFIDTWVDLRRYQYSGDVFTGFKLPSTYITDNGGKPVQRLRPRYNSEYVWNLDALKKLGGDALDYHTKPVWFSEK